MTGEDGELPAPGPPAASGARRRRVVILGCGFAGFQTALELGRRYVTRWADVCLIDSRDYHLFTPLLYEAATGAIRTRRLFFPVGPTLARMEIPFLQKRVRQVDLAARRLVLDEGEVPYDYLVLAAGSQTEFFGRADLVSHTFHLKTAADADLLHQHIQDCIRLARNASREDRARLLTFAIVGGGPTGVELAGALHEALHRRLLPPGMRQPSSFWVQLVEARNAILPGMPAPLGRAAAAALERHGITVRTNAPVEEVTPETVAIQGAPPLPAGTVVWSAGIRAVPLPGLDGHAALPNGRLRVDPCLRLPSNPEVFVLGDMAAAEWEGGIVPANAPGALQMGRVTARNLTRAMLNLRPIPFRYEHQGDLIAVGYRNAVAWVGGRLFTGLPAWALRRSIYLKNLQGFANRIGLAADWLREERSAR